MKRFLSFLTLATLLCTAASAQNNLYRSVIGPYIDANGAVAVADPSTTIVVDLVIESEQTIVGPYARLRPQALVDEKAHVGNFVELKKTYLGKGSKANHFTYLGDTEVGPGVNFGAGTITCNYDGKNKFKTVVGADCFIGSNTSLVAPVTIGDGALIGAGSVIVEDVPAGKMALGRGRQVIKDRRN